MASIKLKGDTSGEITIQAPSVAGTNTLNLQASSGTLATTAQASVGTKNLIINGDMRIAQRGTSSTGQTTGGYVTVDRFYTGGSTAGTWTISQDTDTPSGQGFATSVKMDCTTANASLSAGSYWYVEHKIEAQNLQHLKFGTASAETLTLSFWVKSNKTGTYTVENYRVDSGRHIGNTYTINTADTWEKKTITINADTTGIINNDNGEGWRLMFWVVAGSNFTSGTLATSWAATSNPNRVSSSNVNLADSTSNYINITGVQLEVGENATPFENRMYSTELAMCERYFQKNYLMEDAPGVATSGENTRYMHGSSDGSSNGAAGVFWRGRMRATPTVTWYTDGGTQGQWNYARSGASGTGSFIAYRVGDTGANGYMGVGVAWSPCSVWGNWTANAEL